MLLTRVPLSSVGVIPKGDKDAILNSIVETYRSSTTNTKDQHRKKYKGKPRNKIHKISKYVVKDQTKCLIFCEKEMIALFSLREKRA